MKMVMEKSWNMKNWLKVMEFCAQSWNCAKSVFFGHHQEIKQQSRKFAFSDVFHKTSPMQNQEEIRSWKIKKWSWKNMFSSLWEPCKMRTDFSFTIYCLRFSLKGISHLNTPWVREISSYLT